ncbi:MAG: glycosyltransferase family 4 protein [Planctomycetes bacterium]|nr:glycosyltransferase family 4 protein [Planctomycetota bacterium]
MHLVYIHQHFCTNEGSSGTRSYDIARHLAAQGHRVTMVSGISDSCGVERPAWYRLFMRRRMEGFDVIFCNVFYSNKLKPWRRTWSFCWFAVLAALRGLFLRKVDLIFATSTPLTVGIPGYLLSKLHWAPFVFEVRDIWPESLVRSGWVTEKKLSIRLMAGLEAFVYKRACKILVVSPGFEVRLVERGVPAEKLKTIPLGADGDLFREVTPDESFREQYGLQGKFVAIYTGAHGKANGLDYILDAAERSKDRPEIAYVLLGSGSERDRLREEARSRGLTNVVFADAVSKVRLPGILAVCQVGLMILKDIGEPRPVLPNKIFDYMFMGMPAVVNFAGPTWDMVQEEECGLFADPLHPESLADCVARLMGDCELARRLGENGRQAARGKYDRGIIADQLAEAFQDVLKRR